MHLSLLGLSHFHCLIDVEMVVFQELLCFLASVLHWCSIYIQQCCARPLSGIFIIMDVCLVILKVSYIFFWHLLSLCHQCTPLLIDSEFQWRKLTSPNSIIWMSLQDKVSCVIAITYQLIPWIASDWLLHHLLHVTPTTEAVGFLRA